MSSRPCSSRVWSNSSRLSRATCRECGSGHENRRASAWIDARRIARGSSVRSTGSWRPIASSTMPSRSAHSLIVSSWTSKSSIAVARNSAPATMSSTRFVSRPLIFWRCADVDSRSSWWSGSNSSREKLSWLSERGTDSSRRAATISARSSSVPLLPIAIFGSNRMTSTASGPSTSTRCSRSRRRSRFEIGSEVTNCALRRATPSRSLAAHCSPVESPTMISTLPPPRSKHSAGPGIDQHRGADRGEDQPRLLEPVDDVRGDAGLRLDAIEHRVAVASRCAARSSRRRGSRSRPRPRRASGTGASSAPRRPRPPG